jgi:hypothetical protein
MGAPRTQSQSRSWGSPKTRTAKVHQPTTSGARGRIIPQNERPLFFGQGGVQVQHERVGIDPKLGDDEGNAMLHQSRNVVNIPGQPIQFRNDDGRALAPGEIERGGERRPGTFVVLAALGFREGLLKLRSLPSRQSAPAQLAAPLDRAPTCLAWPLKHSRAQRVLQEVLQDIVRECLSAPPRGGSSANGGSRELV